MAIAALELFRFVGTFSVKSLIPNGTPYLTRACLPQHQQHYSFEMICSSLGSAMILNDNYNTYRYHQTVLKLPYQVTTTLPYQTSIATRNLGSEKGSPLCVGVHSFSTRTRIDLIAKDEFELRSSLFTYYL